LFVTLLWVFYFYFYSYFISLLSTLPSLSFHPCSCPLHFPYFYAAIHCSSSQLLFLSFLIHSLPLCSPSPLILPQPVTRLLLPPTHSPTADQPTVPNLHNPSHLQSLTQAPYTIITEIYSHTDECHKTQQPPHCFHHSHTPLPTSLSVPP
jgi:hypothetical protein